MQFMATFIPTQPTQLAAIGTVLLEGYFAMLLFIGLCLQESANTSEEFFLAERERTVRIAGLSPVGAHLGSVKPRSVKPRSLKPRSLKPRSLKPRSLKPRSLKRMGWSTSAYLLRSHLATLLGHGSGLAITNHPPCSTTFTQPSGGGC